MKIAEWNSNGLLQHKNEVEYFLHQNNIDILLISETHFTERSHLKIPNYIVYSTNHPDKTAHAGTAIIIKNTIDHVEMPTYEKDYLQATVVKIRTLPFEMSVAAVYCPPRHNIKKDHFKDFFQTLGPKFIAGGDYNSKHTLFGSRLTTTKGRELASLIQESNYSVLSTGRPTYFPTDPNKIPDLLDFFVTHGISTNYMDILPSYDLSSDHSPIIATISSFVIHKESIAKLHTKKTNWDKYRYLIEEQINLDIRLQTPNDVDLAITDFIRTLKNAVDQATPKTKETKRIYNIPENIRDLLTIKRKARMKWQQTHSPGDKHTLNRITNELKYKIKEVKEKSFNDYVTSLNRFDNSVWEPIKNLKKPIKHIPPLRNTTRSPMQWARTDKEKAQIFAEHLAVVFTPNNDIIDDNLERELLENPVITTSITKIKTKQVQNEIKFLNIRKAAGPDEITPKMIKELPRKGVKMITYIYNAILKLNYWPEKMKTAEIVLVPKPGKDPNSTTSYRPISLLPVISKVLEKLLIQKINSDPNTEEWIPDHQFGFRSNHSTIQQIHRINHEISKALEHGQYCTSAFLDISQAFDKVWHPGLLYKIKTYLPGCYYKLLKSYLNERRFRVRVGVEKSDYFPIKSGVPQGSVFGPLLYMLYTADLPVSPNTILGTFADDTSILSTDEDPQNATINLQQHLDEIQKWLHKWKIKINETKSVQVNFTLRRGQCPPVYINNVKIPEASSTKYLGMHLDSKHTWKEHVVKKRKQIDMKIQELKWLIGRRSKLSLDNKILIYKTVIKPIWTYGIELWGCTSKSNIAIIQRSQSKTLRMIANAPWYVSNQTLHEDLQIPYVKEVIKEKSEKHHTKLEMHTNALLQPLVQPQYRRLKRTWPADLR